jgi:hypothetical protein
MVKKRERERRVMGVAMMMAVSEVEDKHWLSGG